MRMITEKHLTALLDALDDGVVKMRALAVHEATYTKAHRAAGGKIMSSYHDGQHEQALETLRTLQRHRTTLTELQRQDHRRSVHGAAA